MEIHLYFVVKHKNIYTNNPIYKMIELYERMLQQQKEIVDKLERLIKEK
ncbi:MULTISPECIES: hypothetical protein [Elizabethkingia]|nr:hypothetical protein [Elizabethkingia sp. S0634]MCP1253381.1 hypothetical protein [Elizabethkingia sp. S0634]